LLADAAPLSTVVTTGVHEWRDGDNRLGPRNTLEPSGELSVGDMVVVGETALTVASAGFALLRGTFTPVRVHEHGTHPIE
jgi:hypothetical protein